jgi:hypothetical protein
MNAPLETGDMFVVTLRVPTNDPCELAISAIGQIVRVVGPEGFNQEVVLSQGADTERLHAELFHGILELRAPRADAVAPPWARAVPVHAVG